jgi:hydroxymethylglutaryl-CoA lyase
MIQLVEVGPRDGLQNESTLIPLALKLDFIHALAKAGLTRIETTSFVSPQWVPQMADHNDIIKGLDYSLGANYYALVPNIHGMQDAMAAGVKHVCVFTAASESFSTHNANCSIDESLIRIRDIIQAAKNQKGDEKIDIRGYISCTLGCPYEGKIASKTVATLAKQLIDMGCYEVALGDTIGIGTANQAKNLIKAVASEVPINQLAVHFHDTYGQALTNIYACLSEGIETIDASVSGLGGCPYAPGAGGNVATEDVVYLLEGLGISTGVNLMALANAGRLICDYLKQTPRSKVAIALARATYFENVQN